MTTELEHGHENCTGVWMSPSDKQIVCVVCGAVYENTKEILTLALRENQIGTMAIHLSNTGRNFL